MQLALFGDVPAGGLVQGIELPPLVVPPEPPLHEVRRLSYSALALFERCGYRYFAERVLGLAPVPERADGRGGEAGLAATEIGDAVHRLLELVPLDDPVPLERSALEGTVRTWYPLARDDELDRISALVEAYCRSTLARRLAALPGARPERPFSFEHDGVLLHGRFDVLWSEGSRALVVDYKSNVVDGTEPVDVVEEEYRLQRLVYALACLRAGAEEVEIVYQFLERPEAVVSAVFHGGDVERLETELSEAFARIRAGDFRPTPSEMACAGCPALDLVCAGPRLLAHARSYDELPGNEEDARLADSNG
jgi:RecB family exonuclease